jgi:3-oxoacyl-(acyl-carrier-protein) synthase
LDDKRHIVIRSVGAVSAVVNHLDSYGECSIRPGVFSYTYGSTGKTVLVPVYRLHPLFERELSEIHANRVWDRATLLGVLAAKKAFANSDWYTDRTSIGVVIGSSRGAAGTYEEAILRYQQDGVLPVATSPITTMGAFSSAVAEDLGLYGEIVDCSMTCSSGLVAIRNAIAGMLAGFYRRAICGGAECALTSFTIAQMLPLRVLAKYDGATDSVPCRPLQAIEGAERNQMCLGEGAAVFGLEMADSIHKDDICILGMGMGREGLVSHSGVSPDGEAFYIAISKALREAEQKYGILKRQISCVLPHAPGTIKGDQAELIALGRVFGDKLPPLYSTKWLTGHTFGAAGTLSIDLAMHLLRGGDVMPTPYDSLLANGRLVNCRGGRECALVVGAGFGGSVLAFVIGKP